MPISTKFKKYPYTIAGDTFISSAKDLSIQRTRNMYAVPAQNSLTDNAAVYSFPGLKSEFDFSLTTGDRGIHKRIFKGLGIKVSGDRLVAFGSDFQATTVAGILGSGLVSMEDNGSVLVVTTNEGMYQSSDGVSYSLVSLDFTPVQIAYLNDQFIALDSDGFIWVANVGTLTFNNLNTFKADSTPSKTVAIKVFNQFLFAISDEDFEPWENTGTGNPPFERMNGAISEDTGIANKDCICSTSSAMYFLGSDNMPYRLVNFNSVKLSDSNIGISEEFSGYDTADAFIQCMLINGMNMIFYYFPGEGKVWVFNEITNLWSEIDEGVNEGSLWRGKTSAFLFGKMVVGDKDNGNIYTLDETTFKDNGVQKTRQRVFRPFAGETIGSPREYMQMKMIQFAVETAVGIGDDDPQMIVDYSTDGGRSFGAESWLSLGRSGDYQESIEDHSNRKFKDLTVRITYTENTRFTLYDAGIYVRGAGRP